MTTNRLSVCKRLALPSVCSNLSEALPTAWYTLVIDGENAFATCRKAANTH
jgi:hypothetical protein